MLTKNDYQSAVYSQDACNLSGLALELAEVLPHIWEEARKQGEGTAWVNHHPIVKLYIAQMFNLAYGELVPNDQYSEAYQSCTRRLSND